MKLLLFVLPLIFGLFIPTLSAYTNHQAQDSAHAIADKRITVNGHVIYYLQCNENLLKDKILLIHGLFGSKRQWYKMMLRLCQNDFNVIVPDLPGYGKSHNFPLCQYRLERQVSFLNFFAHRLNMHNFNIAGNSMGGTIAALYAEKYPAQIHSLAFIGAPFGLLESNSPLERAINKVDSNPFIPLTPDEFRQEMKLLFYQPYSVSPEKMNDLLNFYKSHQKQLEKITKIVFADENILEKPMKIFAPALIIWGEEDRLLNVRSAVQLRANIKGSKLVVLEKSGHLIPLEKPVIAASIYLNFLDSLREMHHASASRS